MESKNISIQGSNNLNINVITIDLLFNQGHYDIIFEEIDYIKNSEKYYYLNPYYKVQLEYYYCRVLERRGENKKAIENLNTLKSKINIGNDSYFIIFVLICTELYLKWRNGDIKESFQLIDNGLKMIKANNFNDFKDENNNISIPTPTWIGLFFIIIGNIYNNFGEHELGLFYTKESIKYLQSDNDKHYLAKAKNNIGNYYSYRCEHDSAYLYFQESLKLAQICNDDFTISSCP